MPRLDHKPHEDFARAIANGKSGTQAYRLTVAEPGTKTDSCMVGASQLLADPKIRQRVDELKEKAEQIAEKRLEFGKEKLIAFLLEVVETPVGEIDPMSRLANEVTRDEIMGGNPDDPVTVHKVKVKGVSKAEAAKQLAQLCGWNSPEKLEVEAGDKLAAVVGGIRRAKRK